MNSYTYQHANIAYHCILCQGFFPEFPYKCSTTYQALAVLRWWDEISATSAAIFSYLIRYLFHLSSIRYKGCGRQSTTFNSWVLSLENCRWGTMGKQFGRHCASLLVVHIAITCGLLCILSLIGTEARSEDQLWFGTRSSTCPNRNWGLFLGGIFQGYFWVIAIA